MKKFTLRQLPLCLGLLGCAGLAHSAGFNLLEQNNSGLGNAYAGSAAIAENASTIYFNPAGMMKLDGLNISGGVSAIGPSFKFKNDGNSSLPTAYSRNAIRPAAGGDGGNAGGYSYVPNLYVSYKFNDRIAAGLGISVPFGLSTSYDNDWIGRFHSRSFDITTININPSLAFRLSKGINMGIGLNIQYIDATYKKDSIAPGTAQTAAYGQPFLVGHSKTSVDNTGLGWNVGFLFDLSEDTRIGVSYRSRIKHKAKGKTTVDVEMTHPLTGSAVNVANYSSAAAATVSLPDLAILSAYTRLNDKWELLADVSWTGWSSIPELTIRNDTLPNGELQLRFKDAWRIAIGANYQFHPKWKLRTGLAWDQSPVRVTEYRTSSLPDNDRYWLSIGLQYQPTVNTAIDVGYTHLLTSKAKINNTNGNEAQYGRLSGRYKANAHIFGLQLSHRF